jgi:hypothetical protein
MHPNSFYKKYSFAIALFVSLTAGFSDPVDAQSKPFPISSMAFPLIGSNYLDDMTGWTPIPTVIQQIQGLGANDVKVTVSAGYYDSPTANLPDSSNPANPSDDKMLTFFKQIKAAGLQLTVQPFVSIQFDPNGNLLDTVHPQPTDFNAWMAAHTMAMVHLAQMAQAAGADRFVLFGDEVGTLIYPAANQDGWMNMIAQVRQVYFGTLTSEIYADGTIFNGGNTHIDLIPRPIIDSLDILGIGFGPWPLTNTPDPTMCQLLSAWRSNAKGRDVVAFLKGVHDKYNKPITYADISFHSFKGDNVNGNDIYNVTIPLIEDQQEQANEYDSFLTVMSQNAGDWLIGVFPDSWNRFPQNYNLTARFVNSPYGENIRGKLAESIVRQWYTGQRSGGNTLKCLPLSSGGTGSTSTTGGPGSVRTGYASLDVDSGSAPYATAVFSLSENGVVVSEVGVPATPPTRSARTFMDFRSKVPQPSGGTVNTDTGIAVVNPSAVTANVTYTLHDTDGSVLVTGHGTLAAGTHRAKFIDQLKDIAPDFVLPPGFAGIGSLDITSDQSLSVLALRLTINQNGETIMTSIPVADLEKSLPSGTVYFPQIADGGGFTTTLVLMNTSAGNESGKLNVFDDNGNPLLLAQNGGSASSSFAYSIRPGGTFVMATNGAAPLVRVGSIQVVPDLVLGMSTPVGSGIFSLSRPGLLVSESGVPGTATTTHARIFVDESSGHDSGLAIAAPDSTGSNVVLQVFKLDGTPTGNGPATVKLSGNGHQAAFAGQFVSGLPAGFTGVLDISSSAPFVAVTLRSTMNQRGDVLLTTFPVADINQAAPAPIVFPHIADGGGFTTEFILLNPSGPSSTSLRFLGDSGTPLPIGK